MPHTNDRTIVSCAGDSEVRVFDLEYGGVANASNDFSSSTRSRRFNDFFGNARWLNETNTNARVYRSHGDRAKRVVTESSPHLFLTCSEDGEVRQWDLRMPSSAYPAPPDQYNYSRYRRSSASEVSTGNVPPPLISYKDYGLELNSISCASSQPQYIALGGGHQHCFLHDRRMLGRDKLREFGRPPTVRPVVGTNEDTAMGEATRCVKRFAPHNKWKMSSRDHGHITACKISDANPNDMVASWSGDHVYSFDIVKSPDARDKDREEHEHLLATHLTNQKDRKRKRKAASSASIRENGNHRRRIKQVPDLQQEQGHTVLRVQYGNGETEEVPVTLDDESEAAGEAPDTLLTQAQMVSQRIAHSLVQLRKTIFNVSASLRARDAAEVENSAELTPLTSLFTDALGQCATLLPEMDEVIRTYRYPVNPSEEDVILQNTLRRSRQASWRLVQAIGCLARVLGGRLQTVSSASDPRLQQFAQIRPAALEGRNISHGSRFCYDFLKAILCWIEGGREAVLDAFKLPASAPRDNPRYFISDNDDPDSLALKLHDYLMHFADEDTPMMDLDANRFETDQSRLLFKSQKHAVQAFVRVLDDVQLETNQGISEVRDDLDAQSGTKRVMDRGGAARFWGVKVGRSLLMHAGEGITFDFVNRAFGGLRLHVEHVERSEEDIDDDDEERAVEAIDVVVNDNFGTSAASPIITTPAATIQAAEDIPAVAEPEMPDLIAQREDGDEEENEIEDDENENEGSDDEAQDDTDDETSAAAPLFRQHAASSRRGRKSTCNLAVPYSSHSRIYKGHCNTRTVKDVNYYGLNDEYVVSGSDDGHFFIWDRKTTKIVNILEGDGEVVNVIQGHPYEPMIACSGIDSTVKIFGPGGENREREAASEGVDIANPGGAVRRSLGIGRRRRRSRVDADDDVSDNEDDSRPNVAAKPGGLKSRRAMHKEYEITSQNDVERRRNQGDVFVTVSSMEDVFTRAWILVWIPGIRYSLPLVCAVLFKSTLSEMNEAFTDLGPRAGRYAR